MIFRPLMRLLLSWTPLTRIATRTRRWSCNFCVTIWLFGHLMLQLTTQTLEMPLQLLSKKKQQEKKLVKSRQASAIGLAFPCSILQFFLLLQNLKSWTTLSTPLLVHSFLSTHQKHHHMYSLKKTQQQILGKTHILNDQVFTKSTTNQLYCRKKEWKEKQNKKWMVLFITYLRPSLQKEKKQGHEVHQTKRCQGWLLPLTGHTNLFWPLRQCTTQRNIF